MLLSLCLASPPGYLPWLHRVALAYTTLICSVLASILIRSEYTSSEHGQDEDGVGKSRHIRRIQRIQRAQARIGGAPTEAEKKVIQWLAQKGPRTGYALFRKDKIISSSTWTDIRVRADLIGPLDQIGETLQEKIDEDTEEMIREAEADTTEAGSTKPKAPQTQPSSKRTSPVPYWLTEDGVGEALGLGANPKRMLAIMNEYKIGNEGSRLLIDMAIAAGSKWARENLNRESANSIIDEGFLPVASPWHPLKEWRLMAAIRSHPKYAKLIGGNFVERAKEYSSVGEVLLSDNHWKTWSDEKKEEVRNPLLDLLDAVHESDDGISPEEARQILHGKGMSDEDAMKLIRMLQPEHLWSEEGKLKLAAYADALLFTEEDRGDLEILILIRKAMEGKPPSETVLSWP